MFIFFATQVYVLFLILINFFYVYKKSIPSTESKKQIGGKTNK